MTPFQFNANGIPPASADGSSALPIGEHPCVIIGGEFRPVKDKPHAGMVVFTVQIIDGQYKGMSGHYRLNLYSDSDQAREIANKQMSALCYVTNTMMVNALEDLFNKPFVICVGPQSDPKYTQVNGVKYMDGRDPGKPGGQVQAPQAAQQYAGGAPAGFSQQQAPQQPAQQFGQAQGSAGNWAPPGQQQPAQGGFAPPAGQQWQPGAQPPAAAPQQWQPGAQAQQAPAQAPAQANWAPPAQAAAPAPAAWTPPGR